jgi:hypothetical protein
MWLLGNRRNYPLHPIPLQRGVVFSYILPLLCGSAVARGIIRSTPFRCRRVSFSHTFYHSYVAPREPAELSAPPHSAAEGCRFLIHFTSPMWLRGSLRNYPLHHSAADGCRFLIHFTSLMWLRGNYPLHPIPLQRGVVFSYILPLLCGSAVACGIIHSTPFRCREVSFSHTFYFSYVAPR